MTLNPLPVSVLLSISESVLLGGFVLVQMLCTLRGGMVHLELVKVQHDLGGNVDVVQIPWPC